MRLPSLPRPGAPTRELGEGEPSGRRASTGPVGSGVQDAVDPGGHRRRSLPGRLAAQVVRRTPGRGHSGWRTGAIAGFVAAGALFVTTSLDAKGLDLRASSVTDLDTVVRQQRERADDLQREVARIRADVDRLGKSVNDKQVSALQRRVEALRGPAGYTAVHGPALTVTLDDAPEEERQRALASGRATKQDLVVHQQDIQAVVNALWDGGAEAMTLQRQRVVSTTGIKCVGNTVVLHGVPYAPPYVITAIGDVDALRRALDSSAYIAGYLTYVRQFKLGYKVEKSNDVKLPAFDGGSQMRYASTVSAASTAS